MRDKSKLGSLELNLTTNLYKQLESSVVLQKVVNAVTNTSAIIFSATGIPRNLIRYGAPWS